jgi:predicted AAA+ superfamily ATPase
MNKEYWIKSIKDWHEFSLPSLIERQLHVPLELKINRSFSLIGPRRTGKTSEMLLLAKSVAEKCGRDKTVYFNFERADLGIISAKELVTLLDAYWQIFPKNKKEELWLFLDEIQNVLQWESFVRMCIDQKIKVIITGSSSKLLSREIATSMRGRNLSFTMLPLSFREFLSFKSFAIPAFFSSKEEAQLLHHFDEYFNFGGYPEAVLFPSERERILRDIFDTAILRDVIERHKIRNVFLMKTLIKALLTAKEFSANKFYNYLKSQQVKVSKDAIYKYVGCLEDSFFVFMLNKFSLSYKKSEQSLPKVYFVDNGLLRINSIDDKGRLLENLVFVELVRRNEEIAYYQDTYKNEVDFLLKDGKRVKQLIQVCYDLSNFQTKDREIRSLILASKEFSCSNLLILSMSEQDDLLIEKRKIRVLPVWKWLLER